MIPECGLPVKHCDYENLRIREVIAAPAGCYSVLEGPNGVKHRRVVAFALVTADGDSWLEPFGENGLSYGNREPDEIPRAVEWVPQGIPDAK